MTILYIVVGIVVLVLVVNLYKTISLNSDENQKYLFSKIIDEYKRPVFSNSNDALEDKILKLLISSKNPGHLVSMVKAYSSNYLSKDEADELYEITSNLYKNVASSAESVGRGR